MRQEIRDLPYCVCRRTTAYIRGAGEVLLVVRKKLGVADGEKALGKVQVLLPREKKVQVLQRS